ncbi:971_t:CDS:2, partial [Racocetra persica]
MATAFGYSKFKDEFANTGKANQIITSYKNLSQQEKEAKEKELGLVKGEKGNKQVGQEVTQMGLIFDIFKDVAQSARNIKDLMVETQSFGTQIQNLQRQLDEDVNKLENGLNNLRNNLEADVRALEQKIGLLQNSSQYQNLSSRLSTLEGRLSSYGGSSSGSSGGVSATNNNDSSQQSYTFNKVQTALSNLVSHFNGVPLQNLLKLEELDISNTDISSGLKYLPDSIRDFRCSVDKRPKSKANSKEVNKIRIVRQAWQIGQLEKQFQKKNNDYQLIVVENQNQQARIIELEAENNELREKLENLQVEDKK